MDLIIIKDQPCVLLSQVSQALNLTNQHLYILVKRLKINKITVDSRRSAITLEDFQKIENRNKKRGRPWPK